MLDSIYKALENFVVEFSLKRLAGAVFLVTAALMAFSLLDRYSPYFKMGRLERATGLLERLAALDANGALRDSKELQELHGKIIRQLDAAVEPPPLIGIFGVGPSATVSLWRFAAGALPWFIFAMLVLPSVKSDPSKWSAVGAAAFIGLVFGFLATVIIPADWVTWKVLISFSIGHFLIFVVIILVWQAREARKLAKAAQQIGYEGRSQARRSPEPPKS